MQVIVSCAGRGSPRAYDVSSAAGDSSPASARRRASFSNNFLCVRKTTSVSISTRRRCGRTSVRSNFRAAARQKGKANIPSCLEDELFLPRSEIPFPLFRLGTPPARRCRAFLHSFPLALGVGGDLGLQAHPSDERRRSAAAAVVCGRRRVDGRGRCGGGGCTCWCSWEGVRCGARVGRGREVRGGWLREVRIRVRSPTLSSSSLSGQPLRKAERRIGEATTRSSKIRPNAGGEGTRTSGRPPSRRALSTARSTLPPFRSSSQRAACCDTFGNMVVIWSIAACETWRRRVDEPEAGRRTSGLAPRSTTTEGFGPA